MKSFYEHARSQLSSLYSISETDAIINQLIESVTGYSRTQLLLHKNSVLSANNRKTLLEMLSRLENSEPLQYVLGETEFFGLSFIVNKSVLIPRPETEELVELIVNENKQKKSSILDIGTGSGCIAISLASKLSDSKVEAWDVSENALDVAQENARRNNQTIRFKKVDILSNDFKSDSFDVIVSNPPYICQSESSDMHANVLEYEPHIALFVPNEDPMLFYRRITEFAKNHLNKCGKLYFEINANYGNETVELLRANGFSELEIIKDIFQKDRFVKGALT